MIISKIHRKRIFYKIILHVNPVVKLDFIGAKKLTSFPTTWIEIFQFRTRLKIVKPPKFNHRAWGTTMDWIEISPFKHCFCLQELKTDSQFGDVFMCLDRWVVGRCWTFCFPEFMAQWRKNSHISQRNAGVLYPRHLRNFICYARTSDNLVIWLILCKKLLAYWSYWGAKMEWTIIAWAYV